MNNSVYVSKAVVTEAVCPVLVSNIVYASFACDPLSLSILICVASAKGISITAFVQF